MDKPAYDPFAAMRIREYRNLMMGRFLFIMGLRMMGTLVGWWIYELTNDPFAIGLIGLSEVIPAVSLSLYAGHIIDISEKRKLLLRGVTLYLVCALFLLLLSTSYTTEQLSKHWIAFSIYIIIFFTGIIRAFTGPTFGTMVASIVPRDLLQNATTWNQGIWLSASVTGHATVGFLIALIGNTGSLAVISTLVFIGFMFMFQIKPKPSLNEKGEKKTMESVKEGLSFVFKTKELLGALSLDLFAVLFGGAVAMIPVFAKDILKTGPIGFGWLNAASDIGSILIVILLTAFPLKRQQGKKLLLAVAGFGVCIIIFAFSRLFWLSFAVLMLSGMLDGISMIIRGTIVQLKTPDQMRGRVMSVNSMFINSSNELGQFESGVAAKLLGVIPSVVFGGCMTLLVVATTWFKAPSLRKMEY
ncbi:nickel resistance MFS transporter NreB [Sediminibacterium sp. KACHI17]|jgi:MFS family permease|uniref:Nickel resistance MFS transporter NreB n=1 Tax=Sediminibacterium sp. KACHI17 TaxID=1751071 RepID=A0AAT9GF66_9BACT